MTRLLALLAALLVVLPTAVMAHQQKITISTIAHNPRTQMLEVVHRVPLHDAEHALRTQGIRTPDIVKDVESRRAFAAYLAKRFSIETPDGPVALTTLGTDIEGGNLMLYQEAPSPSPGAILAVNSQILTDVWARQENRVNMGTGTDVETLVFHDGDAAKSAALPQG